MIPAGARRAAWAAAAVAVIAGCSGGGPPAGTVRAAVDAAAPDLGPHQRAEVADAVLRAARESAVDALLLVAVIERESRFRATARSHRGAVGLMQLRRSAARHAAAELGLPGPLDLHDPTTNIRLGAAYLASLERDLGTLRLALAAYNRGPSAIRRRLRRGQAVRSRYAREVLHRYQELRRFDGGEAAGAAAGGL